MPVRMGMAGGGEGAFIGEIHRMAARLDGEIELVCGAFSSDPEVSQRMGAKLGLRADRAYRSWKEMLAREAALPADARMQFVSIVTPNDLHFPIATQSLESGFHVLSDKPATRTLDEVRLLAHTVARENRCYALTHTYLGYPMVVEARARVLEGSIGTVRRVTIEYSQGWLAAAVESQGNRQAQWRTDPQRAGAGGSIGDIGVHAFNLAEYIAGARVSELCAELGTSVAGRRLDDHAAAFLRFGNGAHGTLTVSQISAGEENDLIVGVYGETGGVHWSHRDPNSLRLLAIGGGERMLRAGNNVGELHATTRVLCRTPAGHPEGFIEAFANLYRMFASDVRAVEAGSTMLPSSPAPIAAALRGMSFIDAMVRSHSAGQHWVTLDADWERTST
jgi:predicted dehydrogenase